MRKSHIINEIVWIIASVLVLVFQDWVQQQVSATAFQWIYWISVSQIVFGLMINPLFRRWLKRRQDDAKYNLSRAIMGMANQQTNVKG